MNLKKLILAMFFIFCLNFKNNLFTYSISYSILTHNETDSLKKILNILVTNICSEDEIVIVDDFSTNKETLQILKYFEKEYKVKVFKHKLNHNFAQQRNYAKSLCKGDYIFTLDGDELPSLYLIQNIKKIIQSGADGYLTPEVHILIGLGYNDARLNEKEYLCWPAYHIRIYKNIPIIKWVRHVHEGLDGVSKTEKLPEEEKFALVEIKHITKSNNSYDFYLECYKKWFLKAIKKYNKKDCFHILKDTREISHRRHNYLVLLFDLSTINFIKKNNSINFLKDILSNEFKQNVDSIEKLTEALRIEKINFENKKNSQKLILNDSDILNYINSQDENGNTYLMKVAIENNLNLVKKLIENGSNVLTKNKNGTIALEHIKFIYFKQNKIEYKEIYNYLLQKTLKAEIEKLLLNLKIPFKSDYILNIDSFTDTKKHTLLMHAAYNNNFDLARLLIQLGANTLIKDADGYFALDHARYKNNKNLFNLLLKYTLKDQLKKLSFNFEGQINLPINDKNQTFLIFAVLNNNYLLAKHLLEFGESKNITDVYNKTAIDYAKQNKNIHILNLLKNYN